MYRHLGVGRGVVERVGAMGETLSFYPEISASRFWQRSVPGRRNQFLDEDLQQTQLAGAGDGFGAALNL